MLTGDLVRPRLTRRGNRLTVDTLPLDDPTWTQTASDLIALWNRYAGATREAWEKAVEDYLGDRVDYITVRGLAKVLTDAADFSALETVLSPEDIRQRLFAAGPAFTEADLFHPQTREDRIVALATDLGTTPEVIEMALYADRPGANLITDPGPSWTLAELITRYNLELHRGVLYWSNLMEVKIYDTFKDFWRYLKLFKLMFEAHPIDGGYHVVLDGPISPFVRSTTRYGRQFAAFLPALLLCERWAMQANIRMSTFDDELTYRLDHTARLTSHFTRSADFDSQMEADFAAEFHEKLGDERGKWQLTREDEVLLLRDTVMIPDFAFTHKENGRRALVEIVGFWHPDYLRRKLAKVRAAGRDDLILLVYEGVNLTDDKLKDVPGEVLYFATKPVIKHVMAAVERRAR
jgi:predicted nuclease of restriction endonuclease-like RecB superfamily